MQQTQSHVQHPPRNLRKSVLIDPRARLVPTWIISLPLFVCRIYIAPRINRTSSAQRDWCRGLEPLEIRFRSPGKEFNHLLKRYVPGFNREEIDPTSRSSLSLVRALRQLCLDKDSVEIQTRSRDRAICIKALNPLNAAFKLDQTFSATVRARLNSRISTVRTLFGVSSFRGRSWTSVNRNLADR